MIAENMHISPRAVQKNLRKLDPGLSKGRKTTGVHTKAGVGIEKALLFWMIHTKE